MTLQEILQILGGIGVIASMIYVGIQIRNSARAVRASTFLQLSHTMMGSLFNMANSGELTDIVLRGGDDFAALPRLAKARFRFHSMFVLSFNQNVFQQQKFGALHADDWNSFSADLVSFFDMKGAREVWPQSGGASTLTSRPMWIRSSQRPHVGIQWWIIHLARPRRQQNPSAARLPRNPPQKRDKAPLVRLCCRPSRNSRLRWVECLKT